MKVNQLRIKKDMKVSELLDQFDSSGVLGSGRVARASNLITRMIEDEDMGIFMSVAGPMVPGGMRNIIADMIKEGYVDVLMTSGANITHDLLEAFGGRHYRDLGNNDEELNDAGIGRIADVYTKSDDFEVFESEITKIFEIIDKKLDNDKDNHIISIQALLREVGLLIDDENSILRQAALNDVDIYAPGLIDSMFGLQLWIFSQDHGGGLPKHYTLACNLLKGGIDAGVQIVMDRPETGSLSGAPLEEAKSWSKAKHGSNLVTVIGDVTIIFPLIMASVLDKLED